MKPGSPRSLCSSVSLPKSNPSILRSAAVITICVFLVSWFIISNLADPLVKSYYFGVEISRKAGVLILNPNQTENLLQLNRTLRNGEEDASSKWNSSESLERKVLPLISSSSFDKPFAQGFSNDSNKVDSGALDEDKMPSNSTMTAPILSSSDSRKIDPCKSSITFRNVTFLLTCKR